MGQDTVPNDDSDVSGEYLTPEWVWRPLAEAIGGFTLDPATRAWYPDIAAREYTPRDDGLEQEWFGDVWVNPPYGRGDNERWARKVAEEADRPEVDTITALVPASTGTGWWHGTYATGDILTLIGDPWENGRITFDSPTEPSEHNASFGSAIVTFGCVPDEYVAALQDLGRVYRPVRGGAQ